MSSSLVPNLRERSTQGMISKVFLVVWLIGLVMGNLTRVGDFFATGGLPLIEVLLYIFAVVVYLLVRTPLNLPLLFFSMIVMFSWTFGLALNNFLLLSDHMIALSYALRLILMVLVGNLIGWLLSKIMTLDGLTTLYRRVLLAQVVVGLALYVIFPHAPDLWAFLRTFGLNFAGDPHERRLLGPQLDPNFFGNILVFGLLLALMEMSSSNRRARFWSGAYFLLFCAAIVLTVSRSSLLGAVVGVAAYQVIMFILSLKREGLLIRGWITFAWIGIPVLLVFPIILGDELFRLITRVVTTSEDVSALTRLTSTLGATSYLMDLGVFLRGVGYNYIPLVVPSDYIVTGFYSSMLNTLVAFGLPLTIILTALVSAMCYRPLLAMRKQNLSVFSVTLAYLIASFAMSWFNNLLYYPLFLLLLLPWMFYWYWQGRFVK